MPCVVLDNQDWSDNFNEKYFHKVNIKDAGATIVDFVTNDLYESTLIYKIAGQESSIKYKPSGSGYEFIFSNKEGVDKKRVL